MQAYISESLYGLDFVTKYQLTEYKDSLEPLVMFGMYREKDLRLYLKHRGPLILVWQGSDAMRMLWPKQIKSRECTHYAISHWIQERLEAAGIQCFYSPISATIGHANPMPRGNSVYFYTSHSSKESSDHYGEFMVPAIESRTGLNVITATYETYDRVKLNDVYRDCFINLRLTTFDGCPNTNLEMGLLGRRSIFNGQIPGSIKWKSVDDICESIMREYYRRGDDNTEIAEMMDIYVNSPNDIFKPNLKPIPQ